MSGGGRREGIPPGTAAFNLIKEDLTSDRPWVRLLYQRPTLVKRAVPAMKRQTGINRRTVAGGERVQAFVPHPLPPADPPLVLDERLTGLLSEATAALGQLAVAGAMVPSPDWFLYGFVRKEAVVSSQIEGTQATLQDVLEFEATSKAKRPEDVEEVCNCVDALTWARAELSRPRGLPLSTRLLCLAHKRLMRGVRGANRQPGAIRRSQNWIGGTRPGNARFVPPPPEAVPRPRRSN